MDRLIKGNKAICEPSLTCPQNWGHLSWWGQSKWPHSNLDHCRCVLFGTGSHTAIPSANKAYLDSLSSTFNLKVEVGNHTQTALIRYQLWSNWPLLREESRRYVKQRCTICVASWKSAVCHKRNKDRLDKFSRGFQIETASLSHVAGGVECDSLLTAQNSAVQRYPRRRCPCIIR